ncbi:MAG: hypothetical protein R3C19_12345 [Planctomycetaceae bacterium]
MAEVNAFGNTAPADDWLISTPFHDTTADEKVTFSTWTQFADTGLANPQVTFLHSTDYPGVDPSAYTWTPLAYNAPAGIRQRIRIRAKLTFRHLRYAGLFAFGISRQEPVRIHQLAGELTILL